MPLPAPKLDDRSFQDLVDDAKRFIQERCPEWTDHNVSDPGITLVETFAWMTDLMLYRLNRVPDRTFVKFLDLLGVSRYAPTAASVQVDFRLSAPQEDVIVVPAGSVVSTPRTISDAAITFSVVADLEIQPAVVDLVASRIGTQSEIRDVTQTLAMDRSIPCFSDEPVEDDALYFGLTAATPGHIVVLELECEIGGHGVDPKRPPLAWEAYDGQSWTRCEVSVDETGGLNRSGRVEVHVPGAHQVADVDGHRRAWLRCRVVTDRNVPAYRSSPLIRSVLGYVIGATCEAVNAEFVDPEILGVSSGVAGQVFTLRHAPVVASDTPFVITTSQPDLALEATHGDAAPGPVGYTTWELRADFADSGENDRHFTLDAHEGVVKFGPVLREPDGSTRRHGAIPPKGSTITTGPYRTGGGGAGNVSAGSISVLRSSIPMIAGVTNRKAARGGVDAETVDQAKERGPVQLRVRNRAVTIEDYEYLAREAAPELARVKALPEDDGAAPGVRVLLVPRVGGPEEPLELGDLYPNEGLRNRVVDYLDQRRLVGTRVVVEPPTYLGLRVEAEVMPLPDANPVDVEERVKTALRRYFHPVVGGREGTGWGFGRDVRVGEVYAVIQREPGVDVVHSVQLVIVNPSTGESEPAGDLVELYETDLILPADHAITMVE